ncbi:hypothetical protein R6Z07F_008364 [Ovis aries]
MPRAGVFWKQYRAVQSGLHPSLTASCRRRPCPRLPPPAAAGWVFPPPSQLSLGAKPPSARHAGPWHGTLASRLGGRDSPLEPPRGDGATPSQLDCPLSRLQLFPLTHCCGPGLRPTSQEDKATQTLSPASPSQGVMLPCGVTEEPQRLFYGNAGYRLPLPASFPAGLPLGEQPPEGQWQHRAEIQIARKLQCIADQFHRLHMQQHQQNRNRMWWQILLFLHNVALNGDENRNGAGPR